MCRFGRCFTCEHVHMRCQHLNNTKLERGSLEYLSRLDVSAFTDCRGYCEIFLPSSTTRGRITSNTGRFRGWTSTLAGFVYSSPRYGWILRFVPGPSTPRSLKSGFRETADDRHGKLINSYAILPYIECFRCGVLIASGMSVGFDRLRLFITAGFSDIKFHHYCCPISAYIMFGITLSTQAKAFKISPGMVLVLLWCRVHELFKITLCIRKLC